MKILFMCVANSARSQLAEGLARKLFPNAEIQSAGSHPSKLNPIAIEAMREIGIDISSQYSKSCDDLSAKFLIDLNYVITLCEEEVCPVVVSKAKKLHWGFSDPVSKEVISPSESLKRFRETRDGIKSRLEKFKKEMDHG